MNDRKIAIKFEQNKGANFKPTVTSPTLLSAIFLSFVFQPTVQAQQAPSLGYVFPPTVRAGATTKVQLGGFDFTPDMQFFVHHPKIKLKPLSPPGAFLVPGPPYWFGPKGRTTAFKIPREIPATITIPADTPPGLMRWQVANANGSSATAMFYISAGNEVVEKRLRDEFMPLDSLPITVNGRLQKIAEVDRYCCIAKKDGPFTVELMARRLGADFHGLLEVRNETGRLLASSADTEGNDTALTFAAKKGKTYKVRLHDIDFRGNQAFVYRLSLRHGPRVVCTIPAYGRRGETREVAFVGYGISTGPPRLELVRRQVKFPMDAKAVSFRYTLNTPFGSTPVVIQMSGVSEIAEPSNQKEPLEFAAPAAVTGMLATPSEEDRYVFQSDKGNYWRIALQSRSLGSKLDMTLQVLGPNGKQVASGDDFGGTSDAEVSLRTKAKGAYTCVVRDLSGHDGNAAAVYRLAVTRETPDFALSAPQQIKLGMGGKAQLAVKVRRRGGFSDPITLRVEGLPKGVKVGDSLTIPKGKNQIKLPIECAKDAAPTAAMIRISGTAKVGDNMVTRIAQAGASGNLSPQNPAETQTTGLLLATAMTPPFSVELVDKNRQRAVHRGTTYPAPFVIKRNKGFTGEVQLMMASSQSRHRQGITGPIITVPPSAEKALYPCFMPEWLETDRTTRMTVMGVAKAADPKGNIRYLTKTANARVTMILEGALLKLSHAARELTVTPGEPFEVPLAISQSAKLKQNVRIELAVPPQLLGFLKAEPISLDAKKKNASLKIQTTANKTLLGDWQIIVRATAMKDGRWPVVSQTEVPVRFERK